MHVPWWRSHKTVFSMPKFPPHANPKRTHLPDSTHTFGCSHRGTSRKGISSSLNDLSSSSPFLHIPPLKSSMGICGLPMPSPSHSGKTALLSRTGSVTKWGVRTKDPVRPRARLYSRRRRQTKIGYLVCISFALVHILSFVLLFIFFCSHCYREILN